MRTNYNIYLPLFSGFYESIHSALIEDQENYFIDDKSEDNPGYTWDNFESEYEVDYKNIFIEYSKDFYSNFKDEFQKDFENIGIYLKDFIELESPKYYNYSNDEIIINIDIEKEKIIKYILENKEDFAKYIEKQNTAYDGFIPYLSNSFENYLDKIKNDLTENIITQVMQFYINNYMQNIEDSDFNYMLAENIDVYSIFNDNLKEVE